jgi:hypothetical protein
MESKERKARGIVAHGQQKRCTWRYRDEHGLSPDIRHTDHTERKRIVLNQYCAFL